MNGRPSGFGLVELLVSMALGLLLTMALMQTLLGSRDSLVLLRHGNQLQEDARYLMGRLAADLRAAGSEGCLNLQLSPGIALPAPLAQPVSYQGGAQDAGPRADPVDASFSFFAERALVGVGGNPKFPCDGAVGLELVEGGLDHGAEVDMAVDHDGGGVDGADEFF